jgi:hypothetical protein
MQPREIIFPTGRVWLGNLPNDWRCEIAEWRETTINGFSPSHTSFIDEIAIKLHHRDWLAILGCRFIPADTNHLQIKVAVASQIHTRYGMKVGLNKDFAELVLNEAVVIASQSSYLHAGTLLFDYAAQYAMASHGSMFHILTKSLIWLHKYDTDKINEQVVLEIIANAMRLTWKQL